MSSTSSESNQRRILMEMALLLQDEFSNVLDEAGLVMTVRQDTWKGPVMQVYLREAKE